MVHRDAICADFHITRWFICKCHINDGDGNVEAIYHRVLQFSEIILSEHRVGWLTLSSQAALNNNESHLTIPPRQGCGGSSVSPMFL